MKWHFQQCILLVRAIHVLELQFFLKKYYLLLLSIFNGTTIFHASHMDPLNLFQVAKLNVAL